MATYSINTGTSTQTMTYDIIGATAIDLSPVLNILKDNTDKEINPKDIRDAILTSFSNSAFKQTLASQSTISYIGVDNLNPDYTSKDVKSKVFFGKRAFSGTYSYSHTHDLMTSGLLNSNVDVFLYNTKRDTVSNSRTRIAILSGTNSSLYTNSPYLQSQVITTGTNSSLSLDIINPTLTGGTFSVINFNSDFGTVSINNITFPRPQESYGFVPGLTAASDGRVLKWNNGVLGWDDILLPDSNYIGATGTPTNIYGSTINVNGYPFEFTDTDQCTFAIGDIQLGETFNSVSIVEMLRRMVYDYLPPTCSLSILPPYSSGYVEVGSTPLIKLAYTINKRSLPTQTSIFSYMIPSTYPAITNDGQVTISGSVSGVVITPITSATTSFTLTVSDGTQSNSAVTTVTGIYPYFYGFSSLSTMTTAGLASLTKLVESKGDKNVDVTGSGNFYFIYDSSYPVLSAIYNELGNTISSASFSSPTILTLSSPTGLWASKQFRVYQYNGVPQIGPPSVNYQFKY
jgi:hypothetical protein